MSLPPPIAKRNEPHAVYRIWGRDGCLLYVGCSMYPISRVMQHTKQKDWATDVASVSVDWLPNWQSAIEAERDAIASEAPVWNKDHSLGPYLGNAA